MANELSPEEMARRQALSQRLVEIAERFHDSAREGFLRLPDPQQRAIAGAAVAMGIESIGMALGAAMWTAELFAAHTLAAEDLKRTLLTGATQKAVGGNN
jgi:hypothetical protein